MTIKKLGILMSMYSISDFRRAVQFSAGMCKILTRECAKVHSVK